MVVLGRGSGGVRVVLRWCSGGGAREGFGRCSGGVLAVLGRSLGGVKWC